MVPRVWHRPGLVPSYIGLQLLNHRFNKKTDDRGLPAHLGPTVEVGRPTAPVDTAHRTACIHINYIAYTNQADIYIYIYAAII